MKRSTITFCLLLAGACGKADSVGSNPRPPGTPLGFQPPVVTNADSPVTYPLDLYDQRVEGSVMLKLFVDERGNVVVDSTMIAEGSGYPALDSAALVGVAAMRFAPAMRDNQPVATGFLQPVHFRHPDRTSSSGQQ